MIKPMPTKYRLLCAIPHTDYEVGHVFETDKIGRIYIDVLDFPDLYPVEILLMVKAGILEEVKKEENENNIKHFFAEPPNGEVVFNGKKYLSVDRIKAELAALTKIMEK